MLKRIISLLLLLLVISSVQNILAQPTTLSEAGIAYLKKEEGFSDKPYWDYSQWTIGYGSRCPDDKFDEYQENGISQEDAELLLINSISSFEADVNKFIDKHSLSLNQHQFDMLVCFSYNVGSSWMFDATSSLRNDIINGNIDSSFVRNLTLWSKAGGDRLDMLVRRRARDANMYLNGDYETRTPTTLGYIYYAPNGGTLTYNVQGYIFDETPSAVEIPSWNGHTFMGWYTEQVGGQKVELLTKELSGKTLYAHWDVPEGINPDPIEPINVKVTGTNVNIREGYGTNFKVLEQVHSGQILTITKKCEGSGYTWGLCEKGWICLSYTNYNDIVSGKIQEPSKDEEIAESNPTEPPTPEHVHFYNKQIIEASCETNGYTNNSCECGDHYISDTVRPLGHSWEEWTIVLESTINEEGSEVRICAKCKKEESRSISKLVPKDEESEQDNNDDIRPVIAIGTVNVTDSLIIRSGCGSTYKKIGVLYNKSRVEIFEIRENNSVKWGKIKNGWICLNYVILDSEDTPENKPEQSKEEDKSTSEIELNEPVIKTGIVKVKNILYIRSTPSASSLSVGFVRNGETVNILEIKENSHGDWGRIGKNRWISLNYVIFDNDKNEHHTFSEDDNTEKPSNIDKKEPEKLKENEISVVTEIVETYPNRNDIYPVAKETDESFCNDTKEDIQEAQPIEIPASSTNEKEELNTQQTNKEPPAWVIKFLQFILKIIEILSIHKK